MASNTNTISCEEHSTLVSERITNTKPDRPIGVKRGRSEPPEDTGAPLDALGIRELAEGFTSYEPWRAIPARLLQLRPAEGDVQKEFDGLLEKLEEQLILTARYLDSELDAPTDFNFLHGSLTQLLDNILLSCITTSPLPGEELRNVPSAIALFGQQPTKHSVRLQLASYSTVKEWRKAIRALALLEPKRGHEDSFQRTVAIAMMQSVVEPLDVGKLMSSAVELLALTHLPGAGLTLAEYVRKRREQGFVSELTKAFSVERVLTSFENREKFRIVDVAATARDTQTVKAISDSIGNKPALVVTGESGSGKTVGAMVGATTREGSFAVYLGVPPSIPAPKEGDAVDDAKTMQDEALAKRLTAMLLSSTGLDLTNESHRLIPVPQTSLSIILDELGDRRHILRSLLRLASSDRFVQAIKLTFGVSSVCFIAVGTGCHDIMYPAGSRPDACATIFTGSCDGHVVWRRLVETNCRLLESPGPLAPHIFTLAGGLEVTGAFGSVLDSITRHPEGYVFAATGRALVGNARVAALLMRALLKLLSELWPSAIPTSAPALIECSLPFVRSLHHVAIHQFVALNGLANYPSNIERMECVTKALALTLSCTDADVPDCMFLELCAKKGVLTSHAVEVGNSATPQGGRTFGKGRWVVPDYGRRYRVTEAVAAMYLASFGTIRRPARTGEAFTHVVLEYVTLALAPASIVAEWSRIESLKPLSLPAPGIVRFGLFDLLVDAFTEAGVKMGRMLTLMLPSKFEPSSYEGSKKQETASGIRTLKDVWAALGPEADTAPVEGAPVAIVLNADKASGPDMMVLCPGHFAIHLQLKSKLTRQPSMMATGGMNCEFVKMGAGDAQGGKGAAACCNARQCIEATKSMFPKHYFAIVRCVALGASTDTNHTRNILHYEDCRYIQVAVKHNGAHLSDAFYPLAPVPTPQTPATLCTPCCYPFRPLPTNEWPTTKYSSDQ